MALLETFRAKFQAAATGLSDLRALRRTASFINQAEEDIFIFCGLEEAPISGSNEFMFWAGYYLNGKICEFPASTCNEDLIEVFRNMRKGQVFRITEHGESLQRDQGLGVYAEQIDLNLAVYPVFSNEFIQSHKLTLD